MTHTQKCQDHRLIHHAATGDDADCICAPSRPGCGHFSEPDYDGQWCGHCRPNLGDRPRLLDLFCCAGGAAMGYHRAGFEVVGIDKDWQPNYPFSFDQRDALEYLEHAWSLGEFDAIHASPPCQSFTAYRRRGDGVGDGYADLIAATREALRATGLPYVIENIPGAPLENPVQVCGTGLGLDVQRHRLFESNVPMMGVGCAHGRHAARFPAATNRGENTRRTVEVGVWRIPLDVQQRAMGIGWMTLEELSEAIPPTYTQHIGGYLMAAVGVAEAA